MPSDGARLFDFERLFGQLADEGHGTWAESIRRGCQDALRSDRHGLLTRWLELLQHISARDQRSWSINAGRVVVPQWTGSGNCFNHVTPESSRVDITQQTPDSTEPASRREFLQQFCPWRKGPFEIGGVAIDTEWRSDLKWDRIADCVEWRDRKVLDVGCGNGYFGWRMLDAGAHSVIGLDPFLLFVMQHEVVRRLAGDTRHYVLPLTDACLVPRLNAFDIAVSMGVLYHRTSPIDHLQMLRESLKSGGQLVLETPIVESDDAIVLVPQDRYARMRNVWFIPSPSMLMLWLQRTGFRNIQVIDVTPTTSTEQRRTDWMTFESLEDFLDPHDSKQTVEGHPAPVRASLTARLPSS
ncbi:MAG: tRNA 5-methoxyuridine(34)/uridine 5-oxyacetic acid(34) synthase CmoB [Planctomycetaceae bacterium]